MWVYIKKTIYYILLVKKIKRGVWISNIQIYNMLCNCVINVCEYKLIL